MAAVNSVARRGLPLPAFSPRTVLMYSAAVGGEGAVALQVREAAPGELGPHDHDLLADLLHATADITAGGDGDGLSALLGAASPDLALASDASDSLPLPDHDAETVSSSGSVTSSSGGGGGAAEVRAPLAAKKVRPKPASPNRQGPQQCQVCNKIFGNASALAKHKLTHSDERKYVCGMCAKAFKRQDHLNGHMLTHRNKKPYECKADGCGKSYCDARSLRRHTENHHQPPHDNASSSSSSSSSGSLERDGAGGAAGSSPASPGPAVGAPHHHSDCSSSGSEKSSGSGGSESGSSPPATPPAPGTPPAPAPARPTKTPQPRPHHSKPKTFSVALQQSGTKGLGGAAGGGAAGGAGGASACRSHDVKPVECNLCHRKFKNIPALNGHMRLHGGYFKKDSDSKKLDKKEASGPPLQTASVSVRALIEEKIISRRATAASTPSTGTSTDTMSSRVGFVAPAPPPLTSRTPTEPVSPAPSSPAQFISPRAPPPQNPATATATTSTPIASVPNVSVGAVTPRDSTLIELLKKGNTKVMTQAVKRSASDPGQTSPQPELSFRPELFGVSFQPDDGYFSPALQDDAFQFSTAEQLEELASLEDYASVAAALRSRSPVTFPTSRRLAAVLNSPLPESLADFGACHGGSEADSPGPGLYAGSPGLAYPTPPASQDAHSPAHTAPRASSPLSAAFFTATMSSQEEVEEALEEVLPEECGSLDAFALEPAPAPRRIMLNSEDPLLSSSPREFVHQRAAPRRAPRPTPPLAPVQHHWHDPPQQTASLQVCVEGRDTVPAVFLSPSSVPASPQRRKRRGSPVPPHRSRLRRAAAHYTPQPMLPPDRDGPGLFVELTAGLPGESEVNVSEELVPPRINVGPEHQAEIPELSVDRADLHRAPEQMLWDPGINDTLDDNEVRMFMELAMCAAMPVGGHSREYALQMLGDCGGDVRAATLRLMARPAPAPPSEPRWAPDEVETFLAGLRHYDKDFYRIAQLIRTKDSKQCVQFYYFWKKVTKDYKTLFLRSWNMEIPIANQGAVSSGPVVHGQSSCASSPAPYEGEEFPCKICGKIFNKVKSRSAHMKSHRPLDGEPRRPKIEKPYEKVERFDRSQSQATSDYQSKPPAPAL